MMVMMTMMVIIIIIIIIIIVIVIVIIIRNSNWTEWSTIQGEIAQVYFKIGNEWSIRPIWKYQHDYSPNCAAQGPVTN